MEYKNIKTGEIVIEEDAESYVKEKLGIKIEPTGRFGAMTEEQLEAVDILVEWYFSDIWVKEKIENELYG